MEERKASHWLYTKMPNEGSIKNFLFQGSFPRKDTVDTWVRNTLCREDAENGFLVRSFNLGDDCYAAIGKRFFIRDSRKPDRLLIHVAAIPAKEQKENLLHPIGLIRSFPRVFDAENESPVDQGTFWQPYTQQLPKKVGVPVSLVEALDVFDPSDILRFLQAAASKRRDNRICVFDRQGIDEVSELIAQVSISLPPRLRLNLYWGVGVERVEECNFVAWPRTGSKKDLDTSFQNRGVTAYAPQRDAAAA